MQGPRTLGGHLPIPQDFRPTPQTFVHTSQGSEQLRVGDAPRGGKT